MRTLPVLLLWSLSAQLPAADKLRVVDFDGATLRLAVSTDRFQYSIETSNDRTNWVDRGRTCVLRGGTNEIVLSILLPPTAAAKTTFVKLVR